MNYIKTFEGFEGVKKTKKILKHFSKGRGGVESVIKSLSDKDGNINDLMENLCKRFKVEKVKYMNAGAFGMAFIADDDKIIKLTSQRSEASEVRGLIGENTPGCVEYYDIVYSKKFDIYAILMQKSDPITKKEKEIFDVFLEDDINHFDKNQLDDLYKKKLGVTKEEFINYAKEFIDLKEKLEENNISTNDLHPGNMGRVDGKLVHFDIMKGFTGENDLNKISKVKIK